MKRVYLLLSLCFLFPTLSSAKSINDLEMDKFIITSDSSTGIRVKIAPESIINITGNMTVGNLTVSNKVGIGTTAPTATMVILSPAGTASTGMLYLKPSGTTVANRIGLVLQNESGVCYTLVVQGSTPTAQAIACP